MIRDAMPASFVAGDTLRVTRTFADYPAPTWVVTYYFENGEKKYSVAAAASGTAHALTIDAATTAGYLPGRYRWHARAVSGLVKETIDGFDGWVDIQPDPAAAAPRDQRSWARRALDAIEATLEGKATNAQQSFSIRDRTVSSFTLAELMKFKTDLEAQVRSEEAGPGARNSRYIRGRLVRAK